MSYGRHACLPSASLLAVFFVVSVSWRRRRQQQQQQRRWSPVTRSVGRRQTSRLAPASGRSAVQSGGYYGEWEREGGHWFPLWVIQPWVESLARCPACPHEYCADRPQSRLLLICIDGGPSGQRPWYRVGVRSGPWLQAERRRRGVLARPAKRCARRGATRQDVVWSARLTVKVSRARPSGCAGRWPTIDTPAATVSSAFRWRSIYTSLFSRCLQR